jgi:hypothetical protein
MVQPPPLREPTGHVKTGENTAFPLSETIELPIAVEILKGLSNSKGMALH